MNTFERRRAIAKIDRAPLCWFDLVYWPNKLQSTHAYMPPQATGLLFMGTNSRQQERAQSSSWSELFEVVCEVKLRMNATLDPSSSESADVKGAK